ILIEVFDVHDDFVVRNVGLHGMVGALGACFGRVVSMDSPKARTPGPFYWERTLWDDVVPVMTIMMSISLVTRRLIGGIAVRVEHRSRFAAGELQRGAREEFRQPPACVPDHAERRRARDDEPRGPEGVRRAASEQLPHAGGARPRVSCGEAAGRGDVGVRT